MEPSTAHAVSTTTVLEDRASRQAFVLLRTIFTVAPILFGLDKFTNLLTDWTAYLAPAATTVPGQVDPMMFCRMADSPAS